MQVKRFLVGTKTERGVAFTAVKAGRIDGKWQGDPVIGVMGTFEKQGLIQERMQVVCGPLEGVQFKVKSNLTSAVFRVFKADQYSYMLIVEWPNSIGSDQVAEQVKVFMDSLRIGK